MNNEHLHSTLLNLSFNLSGIDRAFITAMFIFIFIAALLLLFSFRIKHPFYKYTLLIANLGFAVVVYFSFQHEAQLYKTGTVLLLLVLASAYQIYRAFRK